MNVLQLTMLVGAGSVLAGLVGALTGLGGGVMIVPLLTLAFDVDIHYAIGASLVSVIATSSGAAAAFVRDGFTNVRIGMFLEIATTTGSLVGAVLAGLCPASLIAILFGAVLLYSAMVSTAEPRRTGADDLPDALAGRLRMDGRYPTPAGWRAYRVHRVPLGFGLAWVAGILAGLLGIGAGALKVVAMDQVMRIPFKVSTATSNFMIGVTAAAGAGVYLSQGYIDPGLAMPVMLGVTAGSWIGARLLAVIDTRLLRLVFSVLVSILAMEMITSGVFGGA
ncbi:MAG: sulfite exporter TauE/SafE family protein [Deltaproteobacteria bacterium]|nr:sulfite exporter TauE/SafE family protein [Deltaproteobacteria bacterium]